jgi:hypothetical protein
MTTAIGGTLILGPEAGSGFGARIAVLGDVNGDGFADFAASAPLSGDAAGTLPGAGLVAIVYGTDRDMAATIDLAFAGGPTPDSTIFSIIQGDIEQGRIGDVLAAAGDIDGDGYDDVIVGSSDYGGFGTDRVSVILYGSSAGFGAVADLGSMAGVTRLVVAAGASMTGFTTEGVGDLNGDGFVDLIIANPVDSECFVLFGDGAAHPPTLYMTANFETQKNTYTNVQGGFAAGDLNDDGYADLLLTTAGGAVVLYGSITLGGTTQDMGNTTPTGSTGFSLGLQQVIRATTASDINGDGIDDLLIEGRADAQTQLTEIYVLFGQKAGFGAAVDLTALDGTNGFVVAGTLIGSGFGGAGDVNGDGLRDMVVANSDGPGEIYIVFGRKDGHLGTLDLAALDGTTGYVLTGASVACMAGGGQIADVNGDGFGDVVMGLGGYGTGGGAVVLYGGPERLRALDIADGVRDGRLAMSEIGTAMTFIEPDPVPIGGNGGTGGGAPTQQDDELTGTDGADVVDLLAGNDSYAAKSADDFVRGNSGRDQIFGDTGNDALWGDEGDDVLIGGSGDDTLDGGIGSDLMDGGTGNDRFVVDAPTDIVIEGDNPGWDKVEASVDFALFAFLEELTLTGSADLLGLGSAGGNRITGNAGNNLIRGFGGNDRLAGGNGADTLEGNRGKDHLYGGDDASRDVFLFASRLDTPRGAGRDVIVDFDRLEDVIDLRQIDANRQQEGNQAFRFTGTVAKTHSLWWADTGTDLRLRGDVNGDRIFDFEIRMIGLERIGSADLLL